MKSLISFIDEGAEEKKLDKLRILVLSDQLYKLASIEPGKKKYSEK